MLSPFLYAVVLDAVTELAMEDVLSQLFCAYDLALLIDTIKGIGNKFRTWKVMFESRVSRLIFGKPK